jgi:hypothetical protein
MCYTRVMHFLRERPMVGGVLLFVGGLMLSGVFFGLPAFRVRSLGYGMMILGAGAMLYGLYDWATWQLHWKRIEAERAQAAKKPMVKSDARVSSGRPAVKR